jgi:hypothetical protein
LGVDPNPVGNQGSNFMLDRNAPLVREQFNRVTPMVLHLFEQAGKFEDANALRARVAKY